MKVNGAAVDGTTFVEEELASSLGGNEDWKVRWHKNKEQGKLFGFFDGEGALEVEVDMNRVKIDSARLMNGEKVKTVTQDGKVSIDMATIDSSILRPVCITFDL